jgi:hypothetical protein
MLLAYIQANSVQNLFFFGITGQVFVDYVIGVPGFDWLDWAFYFVYNFAPETLFEVRPQVPQEVKRDGGDCRTDVLESYVHQQCAERVGIRRAADFDIRLVHKV